MKRYSSFFFFAFPVVVVSFLVFFLGCGRVGRDWWGLVLGGGLFG